MSDERAKATVPRAGVAPSAADAPAGARQVGRGAWLRKAAGSVPVKWLTGAVTAVFLVATAAFGGLEPVAATPPAELGAGDEHRSELASFALQRAVLIDDLPEAGAYAGPGERVLAVVVDAENLWSEPVGTLTSTFQQVFAIESHPELELASTARVDDATVGVTLQPGVPAEIVVAWLVPAQSFADGDEVRVVVHDHTVREGSDVLFGTYWDSPAPAAVVTLALTDVGAGADVGADAAGEAP